MQPSPVHMVLPYRGLSTRTIAKGQVLRAANPGYFCSCFVLGHGASRLIDFMSYILIQGRNGERTLGKQTSQSNRTRRSSANYRANWLAMTKDRQPRFGWMRGNTIVGEKKKGCPVCLCPLPISSRFWTGHMSHLQRNLECMDLLLIVLYICG